MRVSALCLSRGDQEMVSAAEQDWRAQTYPGFEFIVVHEFGQTLETKGVRVVVSPGTNLGERRNAGLDAATGDVLIVWDDDDRHAPARVERQVAPILDGYAMTWLSEVTMAHCARRAIGFLPCGYPQTMCALRRAIIQSGGWRTNERHDGDVDLMLHIRGHNQTCAIRAPELYTYTQHDANVTGAGHWRDLWRFTRPIAENKV